MASITRYNVGTATVAQNGTEVTFGGAAVLDGIRPDDLFMGFVPIASVDTVNRKVILEAPGWPLAALNTAPYYIVYLPPGIQLEGALRTVANAIATGSIMDSPETAIASSATGMTDIGAVPSVDVTVTGTNPIASFGPKTGKFKIVRFTDVLTLVHSASLALKNGGVNRVTANGDIGIYVSDSSGVWREVSYFYASKAYATQTGTETLANKTLVKSFIKGRMPAASRGLVIGDSTIAAQNGNPSIASMILSSADAAMGVTVNSIAYPGHTINQQLAAYTALTDKTTYDWAFVQVGLNDVDPSVATATTIAQYQALIDAIRSGSPNATVIVSAMNPSKSRMVESLPTTWAAAYQKWLDMNTAIMGGGSTPITSVHYRQDKHIKALNDGADSLAYMYQDLTDPVSPKIHENATARTLIATVWRELLVQAGFLSVSNPDAYSPYFAEISGVLYNLRTAGFVTDGTLKVRNNANPGTANATLVVSTTGNAAFDSVGKTATFGSGSGSIVIRWGGRYTGFMGILDADNSAVYGLRATSAATTDPVNGYQVVGLFGFYDGMGVSGTSNYAADTNPVFGVNAKDQLTGTTYGLGHNLLNVQNNGYVSTYNTVLDDGSGNLKPGSDNAKTLGAAPNRWSVVYAGTGAINTSDEHEKQWIGALSGVPIAVGREILTEIGGFKFLDAIARKGEADARVHFGVRAQRVRDIWVKHCGNSDPLPGFLCYDEWPETPAVPERRIAQVDDDGKPVLDSEGNPVIDVIPAQPAIPGGNRWGIRYDELAMFLLAVMDARIAALEANAS